MVYSGDSSCAGQANIFFKNIHCSNNTQVQMQSAYTPQVAVLDTVQEMNKQEILFAIVLLP